MKPSRAIPSLFIFLLALAPAAYAEKLDLGYWQYVTWKHWENGPCKLYALGEFRTNKDFSTFYYARLAENFAYKALPCLDLEAHYSFIRDKPLGEPHFLASQRLELEINPSTPVYEKITLKWRNRFEFIKKEDVGHIQFVFRHRILAHFPIENRGALIAYQCYDEVFYDLNTKKLTQNRIVPLILTFDLNKTASIDIFLMFRHFLSSGKWHDSIDLGSKLDF